MCAVLFTTPRRLSYKPARVAGGLGNGGRSLKLKWRKALGLDPRVPFAFGTDLALSLPQPDQEPGGRCSKVRVRSGPIPRRPGGFPRPRWRAGAVAEVPPTSRPKAALALGDAVLRALRELDGVAIDDLLAQRVRRYREIGVFGT